MLYKRIGAGLLAAAMAVSLTACGFLSIPSAVQELLSSGKEISGSLAPASDAGDNAGKETPASQEDAGSEPAAEKTPAPHQENKDQKDGKPLSLFWAEDGDQGWKDGELLYTAAWDYLYLSDEDAAAYPALAGALDALNQQAAGSGVLWSEKLEEIMGERSRDEELNDLCGRYTQQNVIRRADQTVLSILHYMELDTIYNFKSVLLGTTNLDPATGKELALADVFTDPDVLPALLAEQCQKDGLDIGGQLEEYFADCIARGDFRWVVGYQNVAFDFPVPELPPDIFYAGSFLPVSLWYHDAPDQFREKFRSPPDQYVIKVDPQRALKVDLDSRDGRKDWICYGSSPGWLVIGVNDQWYSPLPDEEIEFYGTFELYFVHLADGKNLLYMNELSDNAYYTLLVCSLEDMCIHRGRREKTGGVYRSLLLYHVYPAGNAGDHVGDLRIPGGSFHRAARGQTALLRSAQRQHPDHQNPGGSRRPSGRKVGIDPGGDTVILPSYRLPKLCGYGDGGRKRVPDLRG